MHLAIQTLLLPGENLDEKFSNAARYGFDAVEVVVNPQFNLRRKLVEVQQARRANGVPVSDICTHPIHDPIVPEADERQRRLEVLAELISMADELEARGLVSVPVRPPHQFEAIPAGQSRFECLKALTVETLRSWASRLPAGQAALFIEPLNRYEAYFLNRVEQAVEICREVDHPRIMVLADFFHMNIEERSIPEAIRMAGSRLGMVHIADNNRFQPGLGSFDFKPGFAALKAASYSGYISLECWQGKEAVIAGDPEVALPETVRYVRSIWEAA